MSRLDTNIPKDKLNDVKRFVDSNGGEIINQSEWNFSYHLLIRLPEDKCHDLIALKFSWDNN